MTKFEKNTHACAEMLKTVKCHILQTFSKNENAAQQITFALQSGPQPADIFEGGGEMVVIDVIPNN